MFSTKITDIKPVRLKLFDLKSKDNLIDIYQMYKEYLDQFYQNLSGSDPSVFTFVKCPVCNDDQTTFEFELDRIEYERCKTCSAIYTPKMLNDDILREMYSSGVYQKYFNKLVKQGQRLRKGVLEKRKCEQVCSFFDGPGKILDVACGSGSFLSVCKENGWKVFGVDPSQSAVEVAKSNYNIDVHQGYFENFSSDETFDCISILGLEHLQEPMRAIEKAKSMLAENGLIYLEFPSADCFLWEYLKKFPFPATRYIEAGRHYLFFSKSTIDYFCQKFGLEVAFIECNGLDLETIFLEEVGSELTEKILNIQEVLNSQMIGDHYRVFLKSS